MLTMLALRLGKMFDEAEIDRLVVQLEGPPRAAGEPAESVRIAPAALLEALRSRAGMAGPTAGVRNG